MVRKSQSPNAKDEAKPPGSGSKGSTEKSALPPISSSQRSESTASSAAPASTTQPSAFLTLPYTAKEVEFLRKQLSEIRSASAHASAQSGDSTPPPPPSGADGHPPPLPKSPTADSPRDAWTVNVLPKLVMVTEKALQLAADHYPTPTPSSKRGRTEAGSKQKKKSEGEARKDGPHAEGDGSSNKSAGGDEATAANAAKTGTASSASSESHDDEEEESEMNRHKAQRVSPAGTKAQFLAENEYLMEQLRQMQWCPFTCERLLELLSDPGRHCMSKSGTLRGELLQAALRRCILVTFPAAWAAGDGEGSI